MEFQTLKRSHLKRNIVIAVVVVAITSAIILTFTRAKYKTTESIPLVNGTINYTPYDLKMVAMYQEENDGYKSIDTVPTSGYTLNEEKSYCEVNDAKDESISMEYKDGKVYIGVSKKGTKCYLYFDIQLCQGKACNTILANNSVNSGTPNFSKTATTDEGIYKIQDDWGDSYYFRGAVTNNWVKFAGYYWRIIRINGDGSIRMIYNGTSTATTGTSAQLQTSAFNSSYNDNMYVGYMYTSNQVHGLGSSSTIKGELDSWYQTNIANKGFGNKVSTEAGFCGDREPSTSSSSSNGSGGTGTTQTYYGGYIRFTNSTKSPTLKCKNSSDLYTVSGSSKGNKALSNPVGLITADEVAMAGGVYGQTNQSYYLYTNQVYWTMSPYYFNASSSYAFVLTVTSDGNLNYNWVDSTFGVRPVINLSADVKVTGSGTSSDPFVVSSD